jgi:tetratricopeptide (TPR) repeat protein
MGLTVKALIDYERAVDLNPFNCRARVNFALTLRNLGDFDAALNCLDEALLFYKLTAQIYAERGRTYHLRGDWNCAIADYRRAMATIDEAVASPQDEQLLKRIRRWMEELIPNSP